MMIEEIVKREWEFFQDVHHTEGRADCQDDFETFYLQRKSQFEAFYENVLESYLKDLIAAKEMGRNLVMEKYAYMMESTDPDYFQTIVNQLPKIDSQKKELVNSICQIEVSMREEMNKHYPNLSSLSRNTHTQNDSMFDTSFETYLRGELYTYSDQTLWLYGQMIVDMLNHGENLILCIVEHTVKAYGYSSLEDAEKCLLKS